MMHRKPLSKRILLTLLSGIATLLLMACSLSFGEEKLDLKLSNPGYIPYIAVDVTEEELSDRYYYSLLEEEEQVVYCEILQGIREHAESITTHGDDPDLVIRIFTSVYMDWPEFFWLDGTVSATSYSGFVSYSEVHPEYKYSADESALRTEQIEAAAALFLADLDRNISAYDQIRYVYDRLIAETDYVLDAEDNQNICSVLLHHASVCAGYARTFQYLLHRLGIYSIYVTGQINNGENHAWNIVRCGDDYYNVDVTWGDPVFAQQEAGELQLPENLVYYDFLCCSDAELSFTHQSNGDYVYPTCTAEDLNYYQRLGSYYTAISSELFLNRLTADIDLGLLYSELKFASAEIYDQAETMLEPTLKEAALYLASAYQLQRVTYYYIQDAQTNKIIIFWNYAEA